MAVARLQWATAPRPVTDTAIRTARLTHWYEGRDGRVEALAGIDVTIAAGSLVALVGPSGCGKSTLLRIAAGLLEPTMGSVQLGDAAPREARRLAGLGWMAQDDGLLPWRTVAENVALPLTVGARRGGSGLSSARVEALLARVGLADAARRYPGELSGGMRQRAALARALLAAPAYLFLDEPFASLDELTRERLGDLLLELRIRDSAPTTLLVTHSVAEAGRLADRVLVMSPRPGQLVADVPIDAAHPRRLTDARVRYAIEEIQATLRAADQAP